MQPQSNHIRDTPHRRVELQLLQINLNDATVTAPVKGVTHLSLRKGPCAPAVKDKNIYHINSINQNTRGRESRLLVVSFSTFIKHPLIHALSYCLSISNNSYHHRGEGNWANSA